MLSDESNMNDANAQVLYRSAQSINERRGICEKAFIADSFFTYRVGNNGWLDYISASSEFCLYFPRTRYFPTSGFHRYFLALSIFAVISQRRSSRATQVHSLLFVLRRCIH